MDVDANQFESVLREFRLESGLGQLAQVLVDIVVPLGRSPPLLAMTLVEAVSRSSGCQYSLRPYSLLPLPSSLLLSSFVALSSPPLSSSSPLASPSDLGSGP